MVEFGEQLRRAREKKGMTQQSLAEKLYVTRQSVSRWECGDRYPDLLTTKKISEILEVSLDDLLSGKEMEKVVERNPVIENKVANNIMIALYAVVVLTLIIPIIDQLLKMPTKENPMDALLFIPRIYSSLTATILEIACFVFGLVNAIKGSLSPKRMGAVTVGYFISMCMLITRIFPDGLTIREFINTTIFWDTMFMFAISVLPNIIGAAAVLVYFLLGKTHKVWPILIILASAFGIVTSVMGKIMLIIKYSNAFTMHSTLGLIIDIAIYSLIIYQTITLGLKRKRVMEAKKSQAVETTEIKENEKN